MKRFLLATASVALIAGCSDSGGADADGDGTITQQEVADEMADGPAVAMRAGQWEHKVTFTELDLPGVPANMQDMVKGRMGSGVTTTRCLTEDDVQEPNAEFFSGEGTEGCSYDEFNRSGNRMTMKMTCKMPGGGGTNVTAMEGQFGAESFNLDIDSMVSGTPMGDMTMKGSVSGRRIGDC